jgi:hypothetical protein
VREVDDGRELASQTVEGGAEESRDAERTDSQTTGQRVNLSAWVKYDRRTVCPDLEPTAGVAFIMSFLTNHHGAKQRIYNNGASEKICVHRLSFTKLGCYSKIQLVCSVLYPRFVIAGQ